MKNKNIKHNLKLKERIIKHMLKYNYVTRNNSPSDIIAMAKYFHDWIINDEEENIHSITRASDYPKVDSL